MELMETMHEELIDAENRIVGLKQLLKELEGDCVERVYIADDADVHIKGKIRKAIGDRDIATVGVESMDMLGEICEIDVGAACAAILK